MLTRINGINAISQKKENKRNEHKQNTINAAAKKITLGMLFCVINNPKFTEKFNQMKAIFCKKVQRKIQISGFTF